MQEIYINRRGGSEDLPTIATPLSELYSRLIEAHMDLSQPTKSEEALWAKDLGLGAKARILRRKRQTLIAIFMDIMIDNWGHLALCEDRDKFFFVSCHSKDTFVQVSMNESFFRNVAFPATLESREEETIRKVVDGLCVKEDLKGSWLAHGNSTFWAGVADARSYDASNTLKVLFNRLDAAEILETLGTFESAELKMKFLVLCLRLENINSVAWDLTSHDRKIPVIADYLDTDGPMQSLVERTPSIKNNFCFIRRA